MALVLAVTVLLALWCLILVVSLVSGRWRLAEAISGLGPRESIGDQAERWLHSLDGRHSFD